MIRQLVKRGNQRPDDRYHPLKKRKGNFWNWVLHPYYFHADDFPDIPQDMFKIFVKSFYFKKRFYEPSDLIPVKKLARQGTPVSQISGGYIPLIYSLEDLDLELYIKLSRYSWVVDEENYPYLNMLRSHIQVGPYRNVAGRFEASENPVGFLTGPQVFGGGGSTLEPSSKAPIVAPYLKSSYYTGELRYRGFKKYLSNNSLTPTYYRGWRDELYSQWDRGGSYGYYNANPTKNYPFSVYDLQRTSQIVKIASNTLANIASPVKGFKSLVDSIPVITGQLAGSLAELGIEKIVKDINEVDRENGVYHELDPIALEYRSDVLNQAREHQVEIPNDILDGGMGATQSAFFDSLYEGDIEKAEGIIEESNWEENVANTAFSSLFEAYFNTKDQRRMQAEYQDAIRVPTETGDIYHSAIPGTHERIEYDMPSLGGGVNSSRGIPQSPETFLGKETVYVNKHFNCYRDFCEEYNLKKLSFYGENIWVDYDFIVESEYSQILKHLYQQLP